MRTGFGGVWLDERSFMKLLFTTALIFSVSITQLNFTSAALVTFEGLLPTANTKYNGGPTTNANGFNIGGAQFANDYSAMFDSWNGWSYSNILNTTTQSFNNQYASWPGSGSGVSSSYGVGYVFDPTTISFAAPTVVTSADIANTTWTALTLLNGDAFSKKFGGVTGNDPDYLLLTIEGRTEIDGQGGSTGSIDLYLGDYRASNNALDFVRTGWTNLNLSGLGSVRSLRFSMNSTDVGQFGINTPLYFAIDNINFSTAVPEPNSLFMLLTSTLCLLNRRRLVSSQRGSAGASLSRTASAFHLRCH